MVLSQKITKNCRQCLGSFSVEPYRKYTAIYCSKKCQNGFINSHRIGTHLSESTKRKIGLANSKSRGGMTMVDRECLFCKKQFKTRLAFVKQGGGKFCSVQCRANSTIGKKFSPEHLANISGSNASNWQGGKTSQSQIIRHRKEMRLWRESVFKRDNWTCQECKVKGGILNAHHIKPFSLFPELIFAIDNGVTLCVKCHVKTDTFGCKINRLNKKK